MRDYLVLLAPQLPLPFLLYKMPSCTKLHLSLKTVRMARELGAIGIKDSSGDLTYLYSLVKEFEDDSNFSVITGTELFLPETIINGGQGAVAGGANFFPRLFVDLYEASLANDPKKISFFRNLVARIGNSIYEVGKHESKYAKGTKCVLSLMGICHDFMAPPLKPYNAIERAEIKAYLSEFSYDNEYCIA
jgi:4-hydroxy-tetrahydrodipicolinate synthase